MKEKERIYDLLREPNKVRSRHKEILLDLKREQPFFSKLNYLLAIANEQANITELNQEHIEEISVIQEQWENPDFEISNLIVEPEPQIEVIHSIQEDEAINEIEVQENTNPEHTISADFDKEVAEQETIIESSDEAYTSTYIENLKKLGLSHLIPSHVVQEEANSTDELPIVSQNSSEIKSEVDEVHAAKSEDSIIEQENEVLAKTAIDSITDLDNGVKEKENTATNTTEPKAFEDWLSFGPDAIAVTKSALENPVAKKEEIIEKFIKKAPKIKLKKPDKQGLKPVSFELEEGFKSEWATETLAEIYIGQKKYELAERCYNALSLKYPEKSDYFAGRIVELNAIRTQN